MFAAFKERRPWAAALISFVFTPFIGMLYLNRWRFAVAYLIAMYAILATIPVLYGFDAAQSSNFHYWFAMLAIRIVGTMHGYYIARNRAPAEAMRWYSRWYVAVLLLLILSGFAVVERAFLYRPFHIASGSMEPTLSIGDAVLASKSQYKNSTPRRGDLVVFYVPHQQRVSYVKRVIGIPGDHIQFVHGLIQLNGHSARLRGLAHIPGECADCFSYRQFDEYLPGFPAHKIQKVDGKDGYFEDTAVFIVPPNNYFVVGDNRDNSMDSRADAFGFVPANGVIGKVVTKFFDGTTRRWVWENVE